MDYKLWLLVSWKDLSKREQYVKIRRSLVCVSNSGLCLCLGGGRGREDAGLVTWTSSSKVILIFLGKKTESKVCKLKTCVIIIMWNIPLKIINEFHTIYCFICVTSTINDKEWRFKNQGITHNGIQMCIRDAWKNTHLSYFNLNHDSGQIILCDYSID